MHATEYLKTVESHTIGPIAVLHGREWPLKHAAMKSITAVVLGEVDDQELSVTRFPGKDVELKQVRDELLTVSMFGTGRAVVVEDADDFVTRYRAGLEEYVDHPARAAVLILDMKSWRKNTRLAKKVAQVGLELDCSELAGGRLLTWVIEQCRDVRGRQLSRDAGQLLIELVGSNLGLLEQELGKLTAYAGDRQAIGIDDVRSVVGGWKVETTWAMINAVRDGNLSLALNCLDQLLCAGEAPQRILGGINYVFRKLSQATERARGDMSLGIALKESGVFPRDVDASARYLRRIGRPRSETILGALLQADLDLKGASRIPERLQIERLLLRLAKPLETN